MARHRRSQGRRLRRATPWVSLALGLSLALIVVFALGDDEATPAASPAPAVSTAPGPTSVPESVPAPSSQPPTPDRSWLRRLAPGERPPQFVLFSFDGGASHEHWQRLLPLARSVDARFTVFLSGGYLLTDDERDEYTGPGHAPGKASIGFGGTDAEVDTLVSDLNAATRQGMEIGTHYVGHFCSGSEPSVGTWSRADWDDELRQFSGYVERARDERGLLLDPATIRGGRTPCLEGDWAQASPAMLDAGLVYDSSRAANGVRWPAEVDGVMQYWVPFVRVPALDKKVLMLDYNLWYQYNGATDDPTRVDEFARDTVETYRGAYDAAFDGNRAPLVVANHFNDWAGGAFAQAVEDFMAQVCARPETVCATHSEVGEWMALQDPAVLDRLRASAPAQP